MKDFPHKKEQITKQIVSSKLKSVRLKFRQAVDSGRRSGHGHVMMILYELCEKLWGGSPATEQIEGGIESTELAVHDFDSQEDTVAPIESISSSSATQETSSGMDSTSSGSDKNSDSPEPNDEMPSSGELPLEHNEGKKDTTKQRRAFLDEKLKKLQTREDETKTTCRYAAFRMCSRRT